MKKKQMEKLRYITPMAECICIEQECEFMAGSELGPATGGHHSAGDDEPMNSKTMLWSDEDVSGWPTWDEQLRNN